MKLVDEIQHKILDMILNKEYDENNYLPSEGELSQRFGVSRATVREAVTSMEVRGFIKKIHGKGIMVYDNSVKAMSQSIGDMMFLSDFSINELLEVRKIIEIQTAELAAECATSKDIEELKKSLDIMENATVMDENYHNSDFEFHMILVQATGNQLLYAIVNAYTPLLKKLILESSKTPYVIEQKHHFHRNIFDCIVRGDGKGASEAMRIHLNATYCNLNNLLK